MSFGEENGRGEGGQIKKKRQKMEKEYEEKKK